VLTAASVLSVLGTYFERAKVTGVLDQMARTGLVRPRRHEPFSPHNSLVCLIAAALPQPDAAKALAQAMVMRDWGCQCPSPGRVWNIGIENPSLKDVRLIRVLCSEIYCDHPTGWWVSPVEVTGHGLTFSRGDYDGLVPSFIEREYVSVPSWVIGQFAKHHGIVRENERAANAALLGRIQRALLPAKIEAEAAE
jgi:hypothetical protein